MIYVTITCKFATLDKLLKKMVFCAAQLVAAFAVVIVSSHENQPFPPGVPAQHGHDMQQPDVQQSMGKNRLRESSHDSEHVMQHMEGIMNKPKENMTEEELQFYYFKMHDHDNNNKLDGTELVKAVTDFHQNNENPNVEEAQHTFKEDEITNIVDSILTSDDLNGDGFIEYVEFMAAQKRGPPEPEVPPTPHL